MLETEVYSAYCLTEWTKKLVDQFECLFLQMIACPGWEQFNGSTLICYKVILMITNHNGWN